MVSQNEIPRVDEITTAELLQFSPCRNFVRDMFESVWTTNFIVRDEICRDFVAEVGINRNFSVRIKQPDIVI